MFKGISILALLAISTAEHSPFYRKDYTFIGQFDAFYKVHWDKDSVSWNSAFIACDDESAQLFYPKENGEWAVVKNLSSAIAEAQNTTDVIVGIHDEVGLGEFVTTDGQSTPQPLISGDQEANEGDCVIMDLNTGAYKIEPCVPELADPATKRLFVCKKVDERPCPTIDQAYKYARETKKCYKVNNRKKNWHEAWHTCFMEGGILVVPDSEAEARILYELIGQNNNDVDNYFAGFRKIYPGSSFYTVKGKKLEELPYLYKTWYDRSNDVKEDCGVVYRYSNTMYLKTKACHEKSSFICEMKSKT